MKYFLFVLGVVLIPASLTLIRAADAGQVSALIAGVVSFHCLFLLVIGYLKFTDQLQLQDHALIAIFLGEWMIWYNYGAKTEMPVLGIAGGAIAVLYGVFVSIMMYYELKSEHLSPGPPTKTT